MKLVVTMKGVKTSVSNCDAQLFRNKEGRLVITGSGIDVFDLLLWIEQNPLAQFRESDRPQDEDDSKPHHLFAHMYDEQGNVK